MEFLLRAWNINDLESLVEQANNINVARYLTDAFPHPYTPEKGKEFITFATNDDPIHIYAIDIGGKAVGGIGIHPQSDVMKKNAEIGYWLGEPYWNQGIMTKAIPAVIRFGFNSYDLSRIYARTFGKNISSKRVLEKTGFTLESRIENIIFKNEEYLDELIYAIRR